MATAVHPDTRARKPRPSRISPPIPHEHGAWVILYAPMIVGFAAAGGASVAQWALLFVAVTGAFLAREAAGLLLRHRGKPGTAAWLAGYLAAAGGSGALLAWRAPVLLAVAVLGAGLFTLHSALLLKPARKRLDRTVGGELVGTAALALTGPAAYAVAAGRLDALALGVWAVTAAYFGGGILFVKMWLEAARHKQDWSDHARRAVSLPTRAYYAVLTLSLAGAAAVLGGSAGMPLVIAFAPAVVRAAVGARRLTWRLPNLKRVGMLETGLALWFTAFAAAALRLLA